MTRTRVEKRDRSILTLKNKNFSNRVFRHKERDAMKKSELDTLTHFGDYSALTGAKGEPKRKKKKVVGGKSKKKR